jgi:hypothetical protein
LAVQSDLTASVGDYILNRPKKRLWHWFQNRWRHNCTKRSEIHSASEHGARMTAMHKATDNATDLRNETHTVAKLR